MSEEVKRHITALGFDFGMKNIGIAVGQTLTKTANPLARIKAKDGIPNWQEIDDIISKWRPKALVVGIPIMLDGSVGEMASRANKFANRLTEKYKITVYKVNEQYTTRSAKQALEDNKDNFEKRFTDNYDSISAAIILQEWLQQQ